MTALIYLLSRQIKNIIKGISKKPIVMIAYIIIILLVLVFIASVFIAPSGLINKGSNEMFHSLLTAVIFVVFFLSLRQGVEKGSSYFRFSDVNMVFTGPFKSNQVLLYGFLRHMGTILMIIFFSMLQIPNLKNNFQLKSHGVLMILLAVIIFSVISPILGMILYTYTSKANKRREYIKRAIDIISLILLVGLFLKVFELKSLTKALQEYFGMEMFRYFPIVGQLSGIAGTAVTDISYSFYANLSILIMFIVVFVVVLTKTNPDYYEDVLVATEHMEQIIKAKREGRGMKLKAGKLRNIKGKITALGANAIFQKHVLEYRKNSFFLFFDKSSVIIILAGILVARYILPFDEHTLFVILFFSAYILFFFVAQGKWPEELEKPYIFLIPAPKSKKLLYATLTENIKNILDAALLFSIAGFIYKGNPIVGIFCIISYIMFGAIYIYVDIVSRRLFGKTHKKVLNLFAKFFVSLFVITPGIVLMVVSYMSTESEIVAAGVVALWNLLAASAMFISARGVFSNIEIE